MDSIVDAYVCKSSIRGKNPWNILILVNIKYICDFWRLYCPWDWKKSDVLMYEIAPHSKEFASFRRQAWFNLSPGGCGTFHLEATSVYLYI